MKAWRHWSDAAAAAMLATMPLAVAGCGGEDGSRSTDPTDVVSVRVVVSGGITGAQHRYEVSRDVAPPGMTRPEADRVLALAGRPEVREAHGGRLAGAGTCCDVRTFEVTIRYADGRQTRIRTPETTPGPAPLRRLVTLVTG